MYTRAYTLYYDISDFLSTEQRILVSKFDVTLFVWIQLLLSNVFFF